MQTTSFQDETRLTEHIISRRVAGWLVDALILGLIGTLLRLALWVLGYLTFGFGWYLANGLWVIPIAYVFVFAASPAQATPGQSLLGLRIVRDDDLGRPTPAQALAYAGLYFLTMAAGVVWLFAAFFTRRSRCLHDMAAGVAVVRAEALHAILYGSEPGPIRDGWAVR